MKVKVADEVVELKEDRLLFARLMMVCKSRPEVEIKEAVRVCEFSVVSRSLFAADDTMLHCSCKSAPMHILEKLSKGESNIDAASNANSTDLEIKVAVVDGMAEVQSLDKSDWKRTVSSLHSISTIDCLADSVVTRKSDLSMTDVPSSLKAATRTPLKNLLSHTKTNAELLTQKVKQRADTTGNKFVVAWGAECQATHKDTSHPQSDHEEAATQMILHALDATADCATDLQLSIRCPCTGNQEIPRNVHHYLVCH